MYILPLYTLKKKAANVFNCVGDFGNQTSKHKSIYSNKKRYHSWMAKSSWAKTGAFAAGKTASDYCLEIHRPQKEV